MVLLKLELHRDCFRSHAREINVLKINQGEDNDRLSDMIHWMLRLTKITELQSENFSQNSKQLTN